MALKALATMVLPRTDFFDRKLDSENIHLPDGRYLVMCDKQCECVVAFIFFINNDWT